MPDIFKDNYKSLIRTAKNLIFFFLVNYLRGEAVVKPRLNRVPTRNNIIDLGYSAMYNDGKLIGWMEDNYKCQWNINGICELLADSHKEDKR